MSDTDELAADDCLASALTLLAIQLTDMTPTLLAGRLSPAARNELADRMNELAGMLRQEMRAGRGQ